MLRISKNPHDWRLLIWILLLISVFAPWVFDNIYIPSEYPCSIRLRENICRVPVTGQWILSGLFGVFFNSILELAKGAAVIHPLVGFFHRFDPPPACIALFQYVAHDRVWRSPASAGVPHDRLQPGCRHGLMLGLTEHSNRFWLLWGVWLYVGLLAAR